MKSKKILPLIVSFFFISLGVYLQTLQNHNYSDFKKDTTKFKKVVKDAVSFRITTNKSGYKKGTAFLSYIEDELLFYTEKYPFIKSEDYLNYLEEISVVIHETRDINDNLIDDKTDAFSNRVQKTTQDFISKVEAEYKSLDR